MKAFGRVLCLLPLVSILHSSDALASTPRSALLSKLPLRFEQERGKYIARGPNFVLGLSAAGNSLEWNDPIHRKDIRVETLLLGANPNARIEPQNRLPGTANYFIGASQSWRTDVTGYGSIRYRNVYDGIDLIFHGEQGRLEYDFDLAPRADPSVIRLQLSGQQSLRVDETGDLVVSTASGEIRWKRPEVFQDAGGQRQPIAGSFVLAGKRTVVFKIGTYDPNRKLIIDPILRYSTYLGGTGNDGGRGIGLDAAGNVYITGNTTSMDLPSISAFQPNFGGMTAGYAGGDAFVAKFSPAGSLLYLTYLGGSGDDVASTLVVDAAGNAYITGSTNSTDFPVTTGAFQPQFGGMGGAGLDPGTNYGGSVIRTGDAFIVKLGPGGNKLLYSTYFGGILDDIGMAIAVDSLGNAYIAGGTASPDFPVTVGAIQPGLRGVGGEPIEPCCGQPYWDPGDAFVAGFNTTGGLVFSTTIGGGSDDVALTIALDTSGSIYIGGFTISSDFPTTSGALQRTFGGAEQQNVFRFTGDCFITKINSSCTKILYSTYFGGSGDDCVSSIAVDSSNNVYMTGWTSTTNLPTTPGAVQPAYAGYLELPFLIEQLYGDAFVAKLNAQGSALEYLTYLGGSQNDAGWAIAIDSIGDAFVAGWSDSNDFPLANPLQAKWAGDGGTGPNTYLLYGDAFLAVLNPVGNKLLYSSYFGGSLDDAAAGLAMDGAGNVYITGGTLSSNLPTTSGALQPAYKGFQLLNGFTKGDAFYAAFTGFSLVPPTVTGVTNAEGGSKTISPNTWVAIYGSGLAPDSRIWAGPDFVNNLLPTALDGASVTMNGEKAFVYYISATQIDVLTPPDLAAGPVSVVVTNGGQSSAAFSVQAQAYSPAFFVFGAGPYVAATHNNGSLIGPTSLYPGSTTPASPGETITVYTDGFGPTSVAVVSASLTQSGVLSPLPVVTIGGTPATVSFAGLVAPGEFQFNVVVPANAASGDNPIVATDHGFSTQAGTMITVK